MKKLESHNLKGVHGAQYRRTDAFNIKVTKPDGKVFFIPIEDMKKIIKIIEMTNEVVKLTTDFDNLFDE